MKCKLCNKETDLIKKSHIIPNFMYKGLFGNDHELYKINTKDYSKSSKLHTGEYESNILCASCDNNIIGKLETYSSRIFYGGKIFKGEKFVIENRKNQHNVGYTYIAGLDYKIFKLFLLSILWKSSISSQKFFEQVQLGPHEEIIRKMIYTSNPGHKNNYPCFLLTFLNLKQEISADFIGQPLRIKDSDGTRYIFSIGGIMYVFYISSHNTPDWFLDAALNTKGELKIIHANREQAKDIVNYFLGIKMYK